jgi:hypothetical protein
VYKVGEKQAVLLVRPRYVLTKNCVTLITTARFCYNRCCACGCCLQQHESSVLALPLLPLAGTAVANSARWLLLLVLRFALVYTVIVLLDCYLHATLNKTLVHHD